MPDDLKHYSANAFQVITAEAALKLLLLWACVAMVLDAAGLL